MSAIDIHGWFTELLLCQQRSWQRQLVCLYGTQSWCDDQLDELYRVDAGLQLISDRDQGRDPLPSAKAEHLLGSEAQLVVVDLFCGLNADVICIAAGLVRAGGLLVLLAPPPQNWPLQQDEYACWQGETRSERAWFVEYFFDALNQSSETGILLGKNDEMIDFPRLDELQPTAINDGKTVEQAQSIQTIEAWLAKNDGGIVLLSAARGRGKSTCLGQLANGLYERDVRLLVTSSSRRAAAQILNYAPRSEFVAPDRLVQTQPQADLLLVDEAATIPQSILRQLHRLYPKMIMATTQGGYEGTGQGFRLRFLASLEPAELTHLELHDPVRWCRGDALEQWIDSTLVLNPPLVDSAMTTAPEINIEIIDRPGRPEHHEVTRQVYLLLSSAHYRTRPSDLRMLMENPELVLLVARAGHRIIGAALLNPEGNFDPTLCEQVFLGRRRPRGHLLAQMLTAQAGNRRFACLRGLRIQRIAVCASQRRQGLGSRLLDTALNIARDGNYDYLGASFALEPEAAQFWQDNGFLLVHVSYAQGKSSGRNSIAVLKALTTDSKEALSSLQRRLQQQLPVWMTQFLQYMEAGQITVLLRFADYRCEADDIQQADIDAFCEGDKGFELCFASLQSWVMHRIARSTEPPDSLLIAKAVQNRDWDQLERRSGSDGRRQQQQRLRELVAALDKGC